MVRNTTQSFNWKSVTMNKKKEKSSIKRKLIISDSNNNNDYSITISKDYWLNIFYIAKHKKDVSRLPQKILACPFFTATFLGIHTYINKDFYLKECHRNSAVHYIMWYAKWNLL